MSAYPGARAKKARELPRTPGRSTPASPAAKYNEAAAAVSAERASYAEAVLTDQFRQTFYEDGFCIVPGVVPPELCAAAKRAINARLSKPLSEEEILRRDVKGELFPEVGRSTVVSDLFNETAVRDICSQLVGGIHACGGGQIALRFPGYSCMDEDGLIPAPWYTEGWHIDGLGEWQPRGTVSNFNLLCGIVLDDVEEEFSGNFMAFKGSHHIIEEHFQKNGLDSVLELGMKGMPEDLPIPEPTQVCARAGDITLAHYQLAHSVAPNVSPNIRYVIYFRLTHDKIDGFLPESLLDMWKDWPAMRDIVHYNRNYGPGPTPEMLADRSVGPLRVQAKALREANEHAAAAALYAQLVALRPNNYSFNFHAGSSFTWSDDDANVARGQEYLVRCTQLCANNPQAHAVLVHNFERQKRPEDVVTAAYAMARCPPVDIEKHPWIVQLVSGATAKGAKALRKLGREGEVGHLTGLVGRAYPGCGDGLTSTMSFEALSEQGEAIMAREPKGDNVWREGQRVFSQAAAMKPEAWWMHAQAAVCYTLDSRRDAAVEGEPYARETVRQVPDRPLGHLILASNLCKQERYTEVLPAARGVLQSRHGAGEHHLFKKAISDTKKACFKSGAETEWAEFSAELKATFPDRANIVTRVDNSKECVTQ